MAKHPFSLMIGLGKGKPGPDDDSDSMPDTGGDDDAPLKSAAKDLIQAVKADDIEGVCDALHVAFMHLSMKDSSDEGS